MAEIVLLRHSMTKGNLEGRYIGCRTDEPLCEEGIQLLKSRSYPAVDRIYASPMKRCVETAQVIWGCGKQIPLILVPELRECDFGDFENKNYEELNKDPAYQAWIDSGGTLPFPGGESMEMFQRRCQRGFAGLVRELTELENSCSVSGHAGKRDLCALDRTDRETRTKPEAEKAEHSRSDADTGRPLRAALAVHGGTIMAILERFGHPKKDYFDYQVKNGCGYLLTPVEGTDLWNYQCL